MTILWVCVSFILAIVWALTIVDLIRAHMTTGKTVGWLALIIFLPLIGSIVYWAIRKPEPGDADQAYLAEAQARHDRASQRSDGPRLDRAGQLHTAVDFVTVASPSRPTSQNRRWPKPKE